MTADVSSRNASAFFIMSFSCCQNQTSDHTNLFTSLCGLIFLPGGLKCRAARRPHSCPGRGAGPHCAAFTDGVFNATEATRRVVSDHSCFPLSKGCPPPSGSCPNPDMAHRPFVIRLHAPPQLPQPPFPCTPGTCTQGLTTPHP